VTQLRTRAPLGAGLVAVLIALSIDTGSLAESAAAVPPAGPEHARASFDRFAASWMEKLQRQEVRNRRRPTLEGDGAEGVVSYRGYAREFRTELKVTGNAAAPFVGLLRYVEYVYRCNGAEAGTCRVATAIPITEIFRFRNGRWIY
jgi:hypothetical protein